VTEVAKVKTPEGPEEDQASWRDNSVSCGEAQRKTQPLAQVTVWRNCFKNKANLSTLSLGEYHVD
jgi:hypothetical protein